MANEIQNTQQNNAPAPVMDSGFLMSIEELKKRANMVSKIKAELMKPDVHYGVIPGCGNKPTLLKNGAEMLCMAFRLASDTKVEIADLGNGHREYTVTTTLSCAGELVATGVGSCSTMESKYRYRGSVMENTGKPVPREYWTSKDPALLGGKGFRAKKDENGNWMIFAAGDEKMENPDIADTYNTVLKMASKRSLVDAVLKATGGSCEFTQDLEDGIVKPSSGPIQPPPPPTHHRSSAPKDTAKDNATIDVTEVPQAEETHAQRTETAQDAVEAEEVDSDTRNFLYAMKKLANQNRAAYMDAMGKLGFESAGDVPANRRQAIYTAVNNAVVGATKEG